MFNPYAAVAACLALFAAGAAADRFAPIVGANAQLARARDRVEGAHLKAEAWKSAFRHEADRALGWAASFRQAEGLRAQERGEAVAAVNETQRACDARVQRARASALAIQSIVTKEPSRDQNGCPLRQLVDPGRLRDALRPAG